MQIFVDADACPVVAIIEKIAKDNSVPVMLLCDTNHVLSSTSYTDLINLYVKDENQKLQVFHRGSVYLATKKIGKRNPKAPEIEADNRKRQEWNRAVDMALISGISEPEIMEVKQKKDFRTDQECNFPKGKQTKLICKSCYNGDRSIRNDDRKRTCEKVQGVIGTERTITENRCF